MPGLSSTVSTCPVLRRWKVSRRVRIFAWYRLLPLLVVLAFGAISAVYSFAPSLIFRQVYPLDYVAYIEASSERHTVDPYLVAAVIRTESSWDTEAESSQGARGLMQLMPETAQDMIDLGIVDGSLYSADNLTDPATNIEFGCAYLSYLISYFNGASDRAIAAYNAGLSNVDDWTQADTVLHNAITFPETQAYLIRVNNARDRYRDLYPNEFLSSVGE